MAVSAEHLTYKNKLYNNFYYIQTCGGKTRTELSDRLHRILSEQRPEKTCQKKPARKNLPEKTCRKKPAGKNLPEKTPIGKTKNSAGNRSRIHGSCTEKPILRRLHGWKIFALVYQTCVPTKHGKL